MSVDDLIHGLLGPVGLMPLGALQLIIYILGGGLIVASVWTWMCKRVDRREQERQARRRAEREQRWRNLR